MDIKGLHFSQTCYACPEQYDVYDSSGNVVGYVRLRWGGLTCEYPNVGGELIYSATIGDGFTGMFESDQQRKLHLINIADRIIGKIGANEDE